MHFYFYRFWENSIAYAYNDNFIIAVMNLTMDFKGIWINLLMKSLKTKHVVELSGENSSRNKSKNGVIDENQTEVNWEIKTEELSKEPQR